ALIDTSENGQVYIGFDDQGWLAAGYGHDFHISESFTFNLYGELGKWDNGEELLIEGIIDYQVNDNFNVFSGLGYNQSGQVPEKLSDTTINTNKFIAGAGYSLAGWDLAYQYTHENRDGSNVGADLIDQDDYRTNEHEVVLSKSIDDWTPYVKYTYFNTHEEAHKLSGIMGPIDNDSIITLGLSYDF
ncbi:hypothetical protein AB6C98_18575, partial [Vibrio splendidus]